MPKKYKYIFDIIHPYIHTKNAAFCPIICVFGYMIVYTRYKIYLGRRLNKVIRNYTVPTHVFYMNCTTSKCFCYVYASIVHTFLHMDLCF